MLTKPIKTGGFLSIPEAAAVLGISRIAAFKKVKKGQLAAIRIGRNWAVPADELEKPAGRRDLLPAPPRTRIAPRPAMTPPPPETGETGAPPKKDFMDEMGWD